MTGTPFINVPWAKPFVPALLDIALDLTDGDLANAYFVFPHARPALYMTEAIRNDIRVEKPCILPRMESVTSLFSLARASAVARQATSVGILDQVALLLHAIRRLREERGGLLRDLPLDDSHRFFPWGIRLAKLMEELFTHCRVPEDYIHMQDQVTPFAAALLENLGTLHECYLAALEERGWTTPGLDAFIVARNLVRTGDLGDIPAMSGKRLLLAGFHTLTGTQEILFKHLWARCGATVCLHADPKVVSKSPHWSCINLTRWASGWRTRIIPFEDSNGSPTPEPEISFRAGYDVHSQLGDLAEELKHPAPPETATAIVLPDTGLLLPVLHHLPDTDVNISMGYPLARSPLFRLADTALTLQETRRGNGPYTYHWKSLIALLRHPYLKMLDPLAGQPDETGTSSRCFRRFLHHAERVVRTSQRFAALTDLAMRAAQTYEQAEKTPPDAASLALFKRVLASTVSAWENVSNPNDLATALESVANLMRDHGVSLWARFPIDAECLYRLTESVIPQLAHTALKEEALPPRTLFAVLRELLAGERVPFEAYPLVGDQVLGVLETRLLHFDRVFIVDVTEDKLPGKSGHDPLLPDSLRPLAGLPGKNGREIVAAYNFFRLIAGARHVTLYWQEGVETQGLNDSKKMRSRFVEELLWREEKRQGRILSPEKPENAGVDGPLRLIPCVLPPVPREHTAVPMTPASRERMRSLLRTELSPSLLDSYLGCPVRFFYQRIGRIREVEVVTEGRDPLGTGLFLHDVLSTYFSNRLGNIITASPSEFTNIRELFHKSLANSDIRKTLPADDRIMLEEAGPPILEVLLKNHIGKTPLHVEEKFRAEISVDDTTRTLAGVIDLVVQEGEDSDAVHVLDYKTGHVPAIDKSVWHDDMFWQTLTTWHPGCGDETLDLLAARFPSIQLPAYMYLYGRHTNQPVHDAAYVPLRVGEKDLALFGDTMDNAERGRLIAEKIPLLLVFILRHMEHAEIFTPKPSKNCDWCLYKNLCIITAR